MSPSTTSGIKELVRSFNARALRQCKKTPEARKNRFLTCGLSGASLKPSGAILKPSGTKPIRTLLCPQLLLLCPNWMEITLLIRTLFAPTALAMLLILSVARAHAQNGSAGPGEPAQIPAAQTSPATEAQGSNSISAPFKIQAPQIGGYKMKAGIKSQNTSARAYELDNVNGRRYIQKQEYYLGFVHENGWGLYGQAVTSGPTYAGQGNRLKGSGVVGAGDPSMTILHPDWYRGSSLTLAGQLRSYFPVTDRSQDRQQHHFAYYLYTTVKLARSWTIWNQTVPRYFSQSYYQAKDTTYYIEDLGTLAKAVSTRWSLGVGEWTQVEAHQETKTGVAVDLKAFARFAPIANIWIEPRFIIPALIKNAVYDQAQAVSLSNARVELYAQITL